MAALKLDYTVHSVDEVPIQRDVVVDGQTVQATVAGLSVQLTSPQGSIFLTLSGPQAANHPFTAGATLTVTFGGK